MRTIGDISTISTVTCPTGWEPKKFGTSYVTNGCIKTGSKPSYIGAEIIDCRWGHKFDADGWPTGECARAGDNTSTGSWIEFLWNAAMNIRSMISPSVSVERKDAGKLVVENCARTLNKTIYMNNLRFDTDGVPVDCISSSVAGTSPDGTFTGTSGTGSGMSGMNRCFYPSAKINGTAPGFTVWCASDYNDCHEGEPSGRAVAITGLSLGAPSSCEGSWSGGGFEYCNTGPSGPATEVAKCVANCVSSNPAAYNSSSCVGFRGAQASGSGSGYSTACGQYMASSACTAVPGCAWAATYCYSTGNMSGGSCPSGSNYDIADNNQGYCRAGTMCGPLNASSMTSFTTSLCASFPDSFPMTSGFGGMTGGGGMGMSGVNTTWTFKDGTTQSSMISSTVDAVRLAAKKSECAQLYFGGWMPDAGVSSSANFGFPICSSTPGSGSGGTMGGGYGDVCGNSIVNAVLFGSHSHGSNTEGNICVGNDEMNYAIVSSSGGIMRQSRCLSSGCSELMGGMTGGGGMSGGAACNANFRCDGGETAMSCPAECGGSNYGSATTCGQQTTSAYCTATSGCAWAGTYCYSGSTSGSVATSCDRIFDSTQCTPNGCGPLIGPGLSCGWGGGYVAPYSSDGSTMCAQAGGTWNSGAMPPCQMPGTSSSGSYSSGCAASSQYMCNGVCVAMGSPCGSSYGGSSGGGTSSCPSGSTYDPANAGYNCRKSDNTCITSDGSPTTCMPDDYMMPVSAVRKESLFAQLLSQISDVLTGVGSRPQMIKRIPLDPNKYLSVGGNDQQLNFFAASKFSSQPGSVSDASTRLRNIIKNTPSRTGRSNIRIRR